MYVCMYRNICKYVYIYTICVYICVYGVSEC